ncbi:MAG: transglutaminase domain-containing protein [Clostridia bacterium]|nr:transglutaminase domain-containing protein [Clostridia bacterium]
MKKIQYATALAVVLLLLLSLLGCNGGQTPPTEEVLTRNLVWAVGVPLPRAEDFIVSLPEGAAARFAQEYSFSTLGEYRLSLIVTDARGREQTYEVLFTLQKDLDPPVIHGAKDLSAYLGDGISYRTGVSVTDNCGGSLDLQVDSSLVDRTTPGAYPVTYIATDAAGNRAEVTVTLYLYQEKITWEMLCARLDPIIKEFVPTAGSKEQQARAVYGYVFYHVAYTSTSDKNDWIRAAYEGLRTGEGDCYTYFALSKAFFERLGIENMDIQRTRGLVDERHYWNYVNIGTTDQPRWYHFDACRLQGMQHSGCLLTERQIASYTHLRANEQGVTGYFYAYDSSKYPPCAEQIITSTPSLEPYAED